MVTPWGAYQFDALCLVTGREAEKAISDGKNPFEQQKPSYGQSFQDPRQFKKIEKVKVKADGTW